MSDLYNAIFPVEKVPTTVLEFMKQRKAEDRAFRLKLTIIGVLSTIAIYIFVSIKHRSLIEKLDSDEGEGLPRQARHFTGHRSSGIRMAFAIEFPTWAKSLGYNNEYTPYFVWIVNSYYSSVSTAQLVHLVFELESSPAVVTDRYEIRECGGKSAIDLNKNHLCSKQNPLYSGGNSNESSPSLFQQSVDRIFATKASWLEQVNILKVPPPEPENPILHGVKQALPFVNTLMMAAMMMPPLPI